WHGGMIARGRRATGYERATSGTTRSGRAEMRASTPQLNSRRASASVSTVHTCTLRSARCASATDRGDTTPVLPDHPRNCSPPLGHVTRVPPPPHPRPAPPAADGAPPPSRAAGGGPTPRRNPPHRAEHAAPERAARHAVHRARRADHVDHGAGQFGPVHLELD